MAGIVSDRVFARKLTFFKLVYDFYIYGDIGESAIKQFGTYLYPVAPTKPGFGR